MRQFVFEVEDEESADAINKKMGADMFETKVVYRKQKPFKMINQLPKVRSAPTKLRKAVITHIINDSNNQRLMLGDSSMIPVPGGKGPLKPQGTISSVKQLRIDHSKKYEVVNFNLKKHGF